MEEATSENGDGFGGDERGRGADKVDDGKEIEEEKDDEEVEWLEAWFGAPFVFALNERATGLEREEGSESEGIDDRKAIFVGDNVSGCDDVNPFPLPLQLPLVETPAVAVAAAAAAMVAL